MNDQLLYLTRLPEFRYGKDPARHNIYLGVSDFWHSDLLVPYYYRNSLKVLFKN